MKIYDQAQWTEDKTFKAKPGQQITEEVFEHFLNCLPPICWRNGQFLCSEPYDANTGNGHFRYNAFMQIGDKYYYAGLKTRQQADTMLFKNINY